MRMSFAIVAALLCGACSSESPTMSRVPPNATTACAKGTTQVCSCAGGKSGIATCGTTWSACDCSQAPSSDFGNSATPTPTSAADAGGNAAPSERSECSPGLYLGTYSCEIVLFGGLPVPLDGDVSFNLSINEMVVPGECDEFCDDLVISENGGTLFGLAGLVGFETQLQGALDCASGEFRATGIGGRWGNPISSDPNDPDALLTVEEPPYGMFSGELTGMHMRTSTSETIAGNWNLTEEEMGITCAGPFSVTLQP